MIDPIIQNAMKDGFRKNVKPLSKQERMKRFINANKEHRYIVYANTWDGNAGENLSKKIIFMIFEQAGKEQRLKFLPEIVQKINNQIDRLNRNDSIDIQLRKYTSENIGELLLLFISMFYETKDSLRLENGINICVHRCSVEELKPYL